MQFVTFMRLAIALVVVLGACATDDPEVQCEVECPAPDSITVHVEDLKKSWVQVWARPVTDPAAPVATTFHLKFDFSVAGSGVPGCPVLDPQLAMSLAGVPGRIEAAGGPYRGARWRCGDNLLAFTPMVHDASAPLVISDDTGTMTFDLGDALIDRSVEGVDHPDWMFVGNETSATFRWSPASDVENRETIYVSWQNPDATTSDLEHFAEPITHVDPATFTTKLPVRTSSTLWLTTAPYRSCGPNCNVSLAVSVPHALTFYNP